MTNPSTESAVDSTMTDSIAIDATENLLAQNSPENETELVVEKHNRIRNALTAIKKYATFAQLLRMGGAIGVVAAMSLFLLQGFEVANDLQRYLTLLAQTMVLTAAGFLVSYLLKDNKGARVFFGLGLISVPVNFAVLGAMLYSLVSFDTQNVVYPALAGWHIAGFSQLMIAALAGAAVLIPVTFFGFAVMARPNARLLGGLSLVSGLSLLIPVRETAWVALIAIAVISFAVTMFRRQPKDAVRLKTLEGRFAQALIFVAPVIMVSRSLLLYSADIYAALILSSMVYMILRISVTRLDAQSIASKLAYIVAIPAALVTSFLVSSIAVESFGINLELPVFSVMFAALMLELKRTAKNQFINNTVFGVSAFILLAFNNAIAMLTPDSYLVIIAGLATLTIGIYALSQQRPVIALISAILLVPHVYSYLLEAWEMVDFGNWMTLAALGITAIIGASLLERYGAAWMASRNLRRAAKVEKQHAEKKLKDKEAAEKELEGVAVLGMAG